MLHFIGNNKLSVVEVSALACPLLGLSRPIAGSIPIVVVVIIRVRKLKNTASFAGEVTKM